MASQVPQPTLWSGLGERSPPEGYFFLQRLLEPPICVVAPYLHTFLNSAGCQVKLFQYQNLSKSIQKNARADLAPPPVCQFAASSLSVQDTAFFRLDFSPFPFFVFPRHISWTVLRCDVSLQNMFSQYGWLFSQYGWLVLVISFIKVWDLVVCTCPPLTEPVQCARRRTVLQFQQMKI